MNLLVYVNQGFINIVRIKLNIYKTLIYMNRTTSWSESGIFINLNMKNIHVRYDTTRTIISSRFHDAHQILNLHVRQRGHELCQLQEYVCVRANYHHMLQ